MSAEAHHNAVVAAIKADPQLASAVFDLGEVPSPAPNRYVVVASTLGDWSQVRLTGMRDGLTTTHTVYCVGDKVWQAFAVGGRVTARLKDARLSITGRNVRLPSEWTSRPVDIDRAGLFPKPFGVIQFDLTSEPA